MKWPLPIDDTDLYAWLYLDGIWGRIKFSLAYLFFFGIPWLCRVVPVLIVGGAITWLLTR